MILLKEVTLICIEREIKKFAGAADAAKRHSNVASKNSRRRQRNAKWQSRSPGAAVSQRLRARTLMRISVRADQTGPYRIGA